MLLCSACSPMTACACEHRRLLDATSLIRTVAIVSPSVGGGDSGSDEGKHFQHNITAIPRVIWAAIYPCAVVRALDLLHHAVGLRFWAANPSDAAVFAWCRVRWMREVTLAAGSCERGGTHTEGQSICLTAVLGSWSASSRIAPGHGFGQRCSVPIPCSAVTLYACFCKRCRTTCNGSPLRQ